METPRTVQAFLHWQYLLALGLVGIASGLVGAAFTFLLKFVEQNAFGFTSGTFAEAITRVSPLHRFTAVALTGIVVAVIWYLLRKYGPTIPSPAQMYAAPDKRAQPGSGWMLADTTLQIINVAGGGSIGREGAPRQLGAFAALLAAAPLRLDASSCRILVACGAGAGLAAIYNIPLAGALFALEVMIGLRALLRMGAATVGFAVASALAISYIATVFARIAVPDLPAYSVHWQATAMLSLPLLITALLIGPLIGIAGRYFGRMVDKAAARAPKGKHILWAMPLCYLLLAALAWELPLVLGNGHAMAQDLLDGSVPLTTAALLIFAKPLATLLTIGSGATGGRLTPSLSTGTAIGIVIAAGCTFMFPVSAPAVALLAAGAFLTGAMRAPITACVMVIEFTAAGPALWPLVTIAVGGAWLADLVIERRAIRQRATE